MRAGLLAVLLATPARSAAPLERARALYFSDDVSRAAEAFEAAVKVSSRDAAAFADASAAWAEAGRPDKALLHARRASELAPQDAELAAEHGWALLRAAKPAEAEKVFEEALALAPQSASAALGAGRAKLAQGRAAESIPLLQRAAGFGAQKALADYYLGRAHESLGEAGAALEAFRRAVRADAYFHEGRDPLARAYLREKRYNEAWRHLSRLGEVEPGSRIVRELISKIRPLVAGEPAPEPPPLPAPSADSEMGKGLTMLRVGVFSTPMGKPRPRGSVSVRGTGSWRALDPKTGRTVAAGAAEEVWVLGIARQKKGRALVELRAPDGRSFKAPGEVVLIRPDDPFRGAVSFDSYRPMRGDVEVALWSRRRFLRLVSVVNLEDYTQGVVGAEMPSASPLEALKAQAVMARTHALHIKKLGRRHKKEGYDLCDEQHCQVYSGVRAENERTRAAVAGTRGRIVAYKGRPAQVIYSSNCGGRTQSGEDVGWGHVPYWPRVLDAPAPRPAPDSPTALRRFLSDWPEAFCRPSGYVHAAHSRWARAVPAKELEAKLDRRYKTGKLKGLRVLRRAPSGHVNAMLVLGSRRSKRLDDEIEIRSMLGVGSLRSTLFTLDVEYRAEPTIAPRRPKGAKPAPPAPETLVPETFVFRGGGWGHGVGLCQSGAIGRAEAGQDWETIVRAYFADVELATLDY